MTRRGLLLFAAMCVLWGIPYLFIRIAVGELTPATLVFVRTGIAALILMPFVLARGGLREIGSRWVALSELAGEALPSLMRKVLARALEDLLPPARLRAAHR